MKLRRKSRKGFKKLDRLRTRRLWRRTRESSKSKER
jgi:hypothetical protein